MVIYKEVLLVLPYFSLVLPLFRRSRTEDWQVSRSLDHPVIHHGWSIGDPGFSTLDSTDEQKPHHCLSGKLWYLQHNCVGDNLVYHKASNILFVLLVVFQVFSCVMNKLVSSAKSCSFCFFVTLWSHTKKNLPHLPVCLFIFLWRSYGTLI